MERGPRREKDRDGHGDGGSESRVVLGENPQQVRDHQRDLAGEPGILPRARQVASDRRRADHRQAHRYDRRPAGARREATEQRHQGKGAQPGRAAGAASRHPPLALCAKQQPDAQRDRQVPDTIQQRGAEHGHAGASGLPRGGLHRRCCACQIRR